MVKTKIQLTIFFAAKDGEALYSQQTRPRVNCGSDHELLYGKIHTKMKKVGKTTSPLMYELTQIFYDYTLKVTDSRD